PPAAAGRRAMSPGCRAGWRRRRRRLLPARTPQRSLQPLAAYGGRVGGHGRVMPPVSDEILVQTHADLPGSPGPVLRPFDGGPPAALAARTAAQSCATSLDDHRALSLTPALPPRSGRRSGQSGVGAAGIGVPVVELAPGASEGPRETPLCRCHHRWGIR